MLNITLVNIEGFTQAQSDLLTTATEKGLEMIQDSLWRSQVATADFDENRGYSGPEILKLLDNSDIKVNVLEFHSLSNTIAYTFVSKFTTYFNDYFLDQFLQLPSVEGEAKVFGAIMHECMHQLGFMHRWFWDRSTTVPYGMQHITEDCYNHLVKT